MSKVQPSTYCTGDYRKCPFQDKSKSAQSERDWLSSPFYCSWNIQSTTCLKTEKHNLKFEKYRLGEKTQNTIIIFTVTIFTFPEKLCLGTSQKRQITNNQNDVKACRYFHRRDRAKSPDEITGNDSISDSMGLFFFFFFFPDRLLGFSYLSQLQTRTVQDLSPQLSGWSDTAQ